MKAREWQVRLQEEIKDKAHKYFVTLTFSDESIRLLSDERGDNEANDIASLAVRRFTERWRKKYKKAPRHWLITELGHPKYKANKKNNGNIPELKDERLRLVAIGCGNCEQCRKMKAREWQVRLQEEIKNKINKHFVTLTFSDESIKTLSTEIGDNEANDIASLAVRRFTERWRKKYKKAPRHWLITELGHPTKQGKGRSTERLHIHGIILEKTNIEELTKIWGYGWVHIGYSCDAQTINYCIKYITKVDTDHKGYKAKIFASKGLGKEYIKTSNKKGNEYKKNNTNETYRLSNGGKKNVKSKNKSLNK